MELSRRKFIEGTAIGATGLLGGMGLVACGSTSVENESSSDGSEKSEDASPSATYECDVVVVGAGVSGLSASVEASDLGLDVIQLEKHGYTGGWGVGTEGIGGFGTSIQKKAGIEIEPVEVIAKEAEYTHDRIDNLLWIDIINSSADNFDWLLDKGVTFSGIVDDYMGSGAGLNVFHWFASGTAKADYAAPMTAAAQAQGVNIMLDTQGYQLIVKNGEVAGIYARTSDDEVIEIDTKAVILATGGVASNNGFIKRGGYNMDYLYQCYGDMTGDGLTMALEVGAADTLDSVAALEVLTVGDQPSGSYATYTRNGIDYGATVPNTLWVNEDGERFVDESAGSDNWMAKLTATKKQRLCYTIFSQEIIDGNMKTRYADDANSLDTYMSDFNSMIEDGGRGGIKADTIDELVKKAASAFDGIDVDTLSGTIASYDNMCLSGKDDLYGKDSQYMVPLGSGPFYLCLLRQTVCVTFGAIRTDRSFHALDEDKDVIPGLYAIGVDGAMLWPNIYTINIPGGSNANNVNSGRTAAKSAASYIQDI